MERILVWSALVIAALVAGPGQAAEAVKTFQIRPSPLDAALGLLSRQAGVDLLFDTQMTARKQTRGVSGRLDVDVALGRLLEGSGLVYRRTATGGYVIVLASPGAALQAAGGLAPEEATTVPELLVVGRKNLNADIRRSRDDIQPYQVATGSAITRSQATSVEDYLRSRLPSNAEPITERQAPTLKFGSARSTINLGGFGPDQTLVLVDGRRLPSAIAAGLFSPDFLQADLNGIPPAAIDRIETLTSTSGGIYGPGAVGGVVNVVLKRDYNGVNVSGTTGVSDRGDARRWRLDGSFGAASPSGDTRVMVALSHAHDDGLRVGQRDFMIRSRRLREQNGLVTFPPTSPSLNILGLGDLRIGDGPPLLNAMTSLPIVNGVTADGLALLSANAGRFDLALSPDGSGALGSALSSTTVNSVIFSIRHKITPRIEVFADVIYLANKGTAAIPWLASPYGVLSAGSNGNPFDTDVIVSFPTPGKVGSASTDMRTARLTAGTIVQLPRAWSGALDLSLARTGVGFRLFEAGGGYQLITKTGVDLFGGAPGLISAIAAFEPQAAQKGTLANTLSDVNLRLAGPLLYTAAGPTTLSVLAETRAQRIPIRFKAPNDQTPKVPDQVQSEQVDSVYAELRAPLVPRVSGALLRGLELQLAARADRFAIRAPVTMGPSEAASGEAVLRARHSTSTLTAGFKMLPLNGILLRASYSTGYLPPRPSQMLPFDYVLFPFEGGFGADPKRPGEQLAGNNIVEVREGGSPDVGSERAKTFSAGIVMTPRRLKSLRVSLDYTRIHKLREIVTLLSESFAEIFTLEDRYPDIVRRGPLTSDDAAKGYTVGPVVSVDLAQRNIGYSTTDIVELTLENDVETRVGKVRFYGQGVWQPSLTKRTTPLAPAFQTAGRLDGPLRVRGNAGLDWSMGLWEAGLNVQFYGPYRITYGASNAAARRLNTGAYGTLRYQGSDRIRSQTYVDATVGRTFRAGGGFSVARLGVRNLFGARPPLVAIPLEPRGNESSDEGIGYSPYGDPRGRRFELSLSRQF